MRSGTITAMKIGVLYEMMIIVEITGEIVAIQFYNEYKNFMVVLTKAKCNAITFLKIYS